MKKIIIRGLQKLFSRKKVFLKTKDTVFCNPSEHLFRIVDFINLHYKNKSRLPIVDIGAADGGTANFFSKNFPGADVLAFEPIKEMFELAKKNNSANKNVTIKHKGIYNKPGKQEIFITNNFLSSSIHEPDSATVSMENDNQQDKYRIREKQIIDISTLDEETKAMSEILLIKIDTQGTELIILENGRETLKKTHLILIEMNNHDLYKGGAQYFEVDEFLRSQNFKLADIIVTYRPQGLVQEYDAIYENILLKHD